VRRSAETAEQLSVYVVEDSPILADLLVRLLDTHPGIRVCGRSRDSATATADIRALRPDVVILDLMLQEGSGFDVLAAMESWSVRPVVLVLTNHSTPMCRAAARELGVPEEYFFDKTTQIMDMFRVVANMSVPPAASQRRTTAPSRYRE